MELALVAVPLALVALWALFSLGNGQATMPEPKPVPVDMALLIMALDLEMHAIENRLRTGQLHHEAEGARQVRTRVREFLGGYQQP